MLRIRLLGEMSLEHDGAPLAPPAGRPARALLGWLALHPGPRPRSEVAASLWPDVLDSSARGSLRSATWALRPALGPAAGALVTDRERLGLRRAELWVDVAEVARCVAAGHVAAAAALAERGPLLPGFDGEWVLLARDEHVALVGAALCALADAAETAGDTPGAIVWARRLAALEPLGEAAHRRLMRALAADGEPAAALAAYRRFAERLRRELGVAPSAATREYAQALRAGIEAVPDSAVRPAVPVPARRAPAATAAPPARG